MKPLQTKAFYCFTVGGLYSLAIYFCSALKINIFPEIGATIVALSLWRGTKSAFSISSNFTNLESLAEMGRSDSLKNDVYFAILGTLTNGFSTHIYSVLKIVSIRLFA